MEVVGVGIVVIEPLRARSVASLLDTTAADEHLVQVFSVAAVGRSGIEDEEMERRCLLLWIGLCWVEVSVGCGHQFVKGKVLKIHHLQLA